MVLAGAAALLPVGRAAALRAGPFSHYPPHPRHLHLPSPGSGCKPRARASSCAPAAGLAAAAAAASNLPVGRTLHENAARLQIRLKEISAKRQPPVTHRDAGKKDRRDPARVHAHALNPA